LTGATLTGTTHCTGKVGDVSGSRFSALNRAVLLPLAYAVGSVIGFVVIGVPVQRDAVAVWLLCGLLCCSAADLHGYFRGLVFNWLPFFGLLIVYDWLRGAAAALSRVHFAEQLRFDRDLFGGTTPTVWLQHLLWHGQVAWYDVVALLVYLTHFFAVPMVAMVLWRIDRQRFRDFVLALAVVTTAALLTYAIYPAAPPWLAGQMRLMAPVARIIPITFVHLDFRPAGTLIEGGYHFVNAVAAVPSQHASWSLLIAIALWPRRRRWLRPLVALYPLAMAFTLVYSGEHFVFDILLGWGYTIWSVAAVRCWRIHLERRRSSQGVLPRRRRPAVTAGA
jgi:PAP2 superfamily